MYGEVLGVTRLERTSKLRSRSQIRLGARLRYTDKTKITGYFLESAKNEVASMCITRNQEINTRTIQHCTTDTKMLLIGPFTQYFVWYCVQYCTQAPRIQKSLCAMGTKNRDADTHKRMGLLRTHLQCYMHQGFCFLHYIRNPCESADT